MGAQEKAADVGNLRANEKKWGKVLMDAGHWLSAKNKTGLEGFLGALLGMETGGVGNGWRGGQHAPHHLQIVQRVDDPRLRITGLSAHTALFPR
jgi:hypothetical protein